MPRQRRLDAPGMFHHVMLRGIDGRAVFLDDDDRRDLLRRLERLLPESRLTCLAWVFMTNHVHAVVQTGDVPLSKVMQRMNTGYARYFNERHGRRGYVFQDRFRSRAVSADGDLIGLVRYVLLNPLAAGLVPTLEALEDHPWCGLGALLGRRPPLPFESVGAVLRLFSEDGSGVGEARRRLRKWISGGIPGHGEISDSGATDSGGLGGDSHGTTAHGMPEHTLDPEAAPVSEHTILDRVVAGVCAELGMLPGQVTRGSRSRIVSEARARIAYLAVCEKGVAGAAVARLLRISGSAVTQAVDRGREMVRASASRPSREPGHRARLDPKGRNLTN